MKDPHHISWKNFAIDDFIDAALRIYLLGLKGHKLGFDNDGFLDAVYIIKKRKEVKMSESS